MSLMCEMGSARGKVSCCVFRLREPEPCHAFCPRLIDRTNYRRLRSSSGTERAIRRLKCINDAGGPTAALWVSADAGVVGN